MEGDRAVLATAVAVNPRPVGDREVSIRDLAPRAKDLAHLLDGRAVAGSSPPWPPRVDGTAHQDAVVRQLIHRPEGQPATPFEEPPAPIRQRHPVVGPVADDATGECEVLRPGDDRQRIELHAFHGPHRPLRAARSLPAPTRPQPLAAEQVAPGNLDGNSHPATIPGSYGQRKLPTTGRRDLRRRDEPVHRLVGFSEQSSEP